MTRETRVSADVLVFDVRDLSMFLVVRATRQDVAQEMERN